ncbi:MAG: LacI family transcriptional regulator [Anaerolineae bacterium]|jgi:DNA-binding LacI/PurR family transcriptional regulator|nr:LacI family transcriptional regulator [Anaerolineae bacterium]
MSRRRVTQKEIALSVGVSQTTVSLILAGDDTPSASKETRERVLKAAHTLGYVPQAAARALVSGRANTLAIILFDPHEQVFRDPYIPNVLTGITEVASVQGLRLLVERVQDGSNTDVVRHLLKSSVADGAILVNCRLPSATIHSLYHEGFSLVLLDADQPHGLPLVAIDHIAGARAAAHHLLSLGHRRIGCIPYAILDHAHIVSRYDAFIDTLSEAGVDMPPEYVVNGRFDPDTGEAAMHRLLALPQPPTAVFAMNDLMALGALRACQARGVRVPDDLALVGYDDMRFAEFTYPALTTIRAPEVEMGRRAAEMLLRLIDEQPSAPPVEWLETALIVRGSCGGLTRLD